MLRSKARAGAKQGYFGGVGPVTGIQIMQRLLNLLFLFAALSLAGCWHEAFHTSIGNATGKKIYVTVSFDVIDVPAAYGFLESGNELFLSEKIDHILYIEYQIDGRKCRMEKQAIAALTHAQGQGVNRITLRGCEKPT